MQALRRSLLIVLTISQMFFSQNVLYYAFILLNILSIIFIIMYMLELFSIYLYKKIKIKKNLKVGICE